MQFLCGGGGGANILTCQFSLGDKCPYTGQSCRSKSRPAKYFVNKCYWQYQFILRAGEKRKSVMNEK